MSNLYICDHPLIQSKLTLLRDNKTKSKEFREIITELTTLICYEATKDLPTKKVNIEGTLAPAEGKVLDNEIGVVALLRSGMGMVDGVINLIPTAKVGHIGLYRDPNTLMPIEYFCKIPKNTENMDIYVLDAMLATGGTASAAIQFLKERNVSKITYICLVSAPQGIQKLQKDHPDVDIYCAAMDRSLNEEGYVLPGLGDVGDRMYGTK